MSDWDELHGRERAVPDVPGLLLVAGVDGTFMQRFSSDIFLRFCLRGMQSYLERYEERGEDTG